MVKRELRNDLDALYVIRDRYKEHLKTVNMQMLLHGKSRELLQSKIELNFLLARINDEIREAKFSREFSI